MNRQGMGNLWLLIILRKNTAITREGAEEFWETLLYSVIQQEMDLDASQIAVVKNLLSLSFNYDEVFSLCNKWRISD